MLYSTSGMFSRDIKLAVTEVVYSELCNIWTSDDSYALVKHILSNL